MPGMFSRNGGKLALAQIPLDSWLALCVTPPNISALGMEYDAVGYTRKPIRMNLAPTDTDPPAISNLGGATFGPFIDAVGATIGWVMMMLVESGGGLVQMRAFWELDEHRTPAVGDTLVLDVGALVLTCA
jgi:hypothetical protein